MYVCVDWLSLCEGEKSKKKSGKERMCFFFNPADIVRKELFSPQGSVSPGVLVFVVTCLGGGMRMRF